MVDNSNTTTYVSVLRDAKPLNKFSDSYVIGEPTTNRKMYKYINMSVAQKVIKDGYITFRFQQPSNWDDEYEMLFYNADYSEITSDAKTHPKLYACCFTFDKICEASWKQYSGNIGAGKNCVRLHINKGAFRKAIADYAEDKGFKIYEGPVYYRGEYLIENLLNSSSSIQNENIKRQHEELFCGDFKIDNYLSLLLLKRVLFEYEKEYRFFLVNTRGRIYKKIDVQVPIKSVVDKIMLSDNCDNKYKKSFREFCQKEGIDYMLSEEKIYRLDKKFIGVTINK